MNIFLFWKSASVPTITASCFQASTKIAKYILISCYALVFALSIRNLAFASEQRIGDFEIMMDAPWRMEPRVKAPQVCDSNKNCGGNTAYDYGAIPVNIAILDAFLPNAGVENSYFLQRALQANESGKFSILKTINQILNPFAGELLSDFPNMNLENFLSLTVSEERNGRFVVRSVYRIRDLHEVERTRGIWQWGVSNSNPPPRPIRELCRQWAGENCSAISTLRNTSEWQAIAMYTPLNKTPGTDVKLKFELKLTTQKNGNFGENIFTQYVNVHLGDAPLPKFSKNSYYGDIHYHSQGTDNDGESGYSYRSALQVMSALGLDFAFATDHASNSKQIISVTSSPIGGVSHVREGNASLAVLRDLSPDRFAHGIEILNSSNGANREVASYPRKNFEFSLGVPRRFATPQLFLGAEVDIIPEYENVVDAKGGLSAHNSCRALPLELKRLYLDGIDGVLLGAAGDSLDLSDTNPSICKGDNLLSLAPPGRMLIRDVQGPHNGDFLTKEFHGRQHMLHLPEDPQNKTAFISSDTSKYGGATRRLKGILGTEFNTPNGVLFLAHPLSAATGTEFGRLGPDIVPYAEAPLLDAFRSQHVLGLQLWNENDHFTTEIKTGEGKAIDAVEEFMEQYGKDHPMPQVTSNFENLSEISEYQREFSNEIKGFIDNYVCEDYNCIGYERGETIPVYDIRNWKHQAAKNYNPRVNAVTSGINMWDSMLMWGLNPDLTSSIDWLPTGEPRRVFMAGGSDAHGDYNYKHNGYLVGLKTVGDGAIGTPRNLVFAGPPQGTPITVGQDTGTPVGQKQIVDALRSGNFIVTDGPIIRMAYDKNRNGKIDSSDIHMGGIVRSSPLTSTIYPLLVEWKSTPEFGRIKNIKLVLGVYSDEYSEGWVYRSGKPTTKGLSAWKEIATGRRLGAASHDSRGQRGKRLPNFTDPTNNSILTLKISPSQGHSGLRRISIDPFEFPIATLAERIETERALCDLHARGQVSSTFKTLKSTLTYKSTTLESRLKTAPKPIQNQKNGVIYKRIDNNRVERPTVGGEISVIPDIEPRPPYFCTIKTFTNPVVPDRMFIRAELEGEMKGNIPYRAFTNPIWFKDVHKAGSSRPVGDGAAPSRTSKDAPVNMSPAPTNKPCSKLSITVCQRNGASCDVLKSKTGSSKDVCRWKSKRTVRECNRTIGIWTTTKSKYAQNYPRAIIPGALGACITEVTNVKNRIQ